MADELKQPQVAGKHICSTFICKEGCLKKIVFNCNQKRYNPISESDEPHS